MAQWILRLRSWAAKLPATWPLVICVFLYILPLATWLANLPAKPSEISVTRVYLAQIQVTLWMSLASAIGAAVLGGTVACHAAFAPRRTAKTLAFVMTLPLLIGFVARNYSWTGLLSHFYTGPLAFIGRLQDSALGVIIVMSIVFTPFAFFIVSQGALRLQPEYFAAARTLGATDLRACLVITAPLIFPSVSIAIGMTFILGLGYFITPQLIGGGNYPFIGNGVLRLLNDLGDVTAASQLALALLLTVLIPMSLIVLLGAAWRIGRRRRQFERAELE